MQKVTLSTAIVSLLLINSSYAEVHLSKGQHVVKGHTAQYATTNKRHTSKYSVTGKAGTLGVGADVTYSLKPKVKLRFNLNGGGFSDDTTEHGIKYSAKLDLLTMGGLVDYHPKAGGFRVSAGLYSNKNKVNLKAKGNASVGIGNSTYNITDLSLNTDVDFKSVAPYLGVGWGNASNTTNKWSFSLDAGILFQGSPNVRTTASSGTIAGRNLVTNPTFQADLAREEQNISAALKNYKTYPVISLGATYRF